MELILLQKVANLGNIGDRVRVKSGYGRNYLLPKGKATLATATNVARFEARRVELEKFASDELHSAQKRAEGLKEFTMKFQPAFPVGWATRESMLAFTGLPATDFHATYVPRMVFLDRLGAIRDDFEPGTEFYADPPKNIRAELEKLLKK